MNSPAARVSGFPSSKVTLYHRWRPSLRVRSSNFPACGKSRRMLWISRELAVDFRAGTLLTRTMPSSPVWASTIWAISGVNRMIISPCTRFSSAAWIPKTSERAVSSCTGGVSISWRHAIHVTTVAAAVIQRTILFIVCYLSRNSVNFRRLSGFFHLILFCLSHFLNSAFPSSSRVSRIAFWVASTVNPGVTSQ